MKKKILIFIVIAILAVGGFVAYQWNKPHRTAEDEKPAATLTADELLTQYAADEAKGNIAFLNKTIQVSGVVSEIKKASNGEIEIVLATNDPMETVNCILAKEEKANGLSNGTTIAVKAICNGYLSLSGVNLNQGSIIK